MIPSSQVWLITAMKEGRPIQYPTIAKNVDEAIANLNVDHPGAVEASWFALSGVMVEVDLLSQYQRDSGCPPELCFRVLHIAPGYNGIRFTNLCAENGDSAMDRVRAESPGHVLIAAFALRDLVSTQKFLEGYRDGIQERIEEVVL